MEFSAGLDTVPLLILSFQGNEEQQQVQPRQVFCFRWRRQTWQHWKRRRAATLAVVFPIKKCALTASDGFGENP